MPPSVPNQFKDYTILREIGRGGMGMVYHARHRQTGEDYALKLLLQPGDERASTRFQREAQALSLIDHPHVISIFEHGQFEGVPYIVMEFIHGQTLEAIVQSSRQHVTSSSYQNWMAGIIKALATGLKICHAQGLTHRDIKPDNILIEENTGRPVLIDFGLVKKDKQTGRFDSLSLTKSGDVLGTIHYMAPEQLDSQEFGDVGGHSDIWALGTTFLYCLTGKLPFKGDSVITIYTAIVMGDPPQLQSMNKNAPLWLNQLVSDCLIKQPQNRIKIEAFIQLLDRPEPVTDFASALDLSQETNSNPRQKKTYSLAKTVPWLCAITLMFGLLLVLISNHTEPLTIEMTDPQNGQELYAHAALLRGKVSKVPATITVEGKSFEVNSDGRFHAIIELPQGKQNISIIVRSGDEASLKVIENVQATLSPQVLRKIEIIGEDAVPALMKALKDRNQFIQLAAAETLARLGTKAQAATPSLIIAIKNGRGELKTASALALGQIGKSTVPPLLELLKTKENEKEKAILVAIFKAFEIIGEDSGDATPALIAALRLQDRGIQFAASAALAKIGEVAISQLIEAAKDQDKEVRLAAITGLGTIGKKSMPAIETLARALKDDNLTVRRAAADYIGLVGPPAKIAISELCSLTLSPDKALKDMSIRALGNIGKDALPAVPALTKRLSDLYPFIRKSAAIALGKIGPGAKSAIPALLKLTEDGDKEIRKECYQALAKFGKEAIPELIQALNIPNRWTRECSAEALAIIGTEAIAPLIRFLNGKMQAGHPTAADALGKMGPTAKAAIPTLLETLKSNDVPLRYGSIRALGHIGVATPSVVKALIGRLDDENKIIQWATAEAFRQLAPKAKAAIPKLLLALQSKNESLQCAAAEALGQFGAPAEEAIPMLIELLGHPRQEQRNSATNALPNFGKAALQPLLAALKDPNSNRRSHAGQAIAHLGALAVPHLIQALNEPNSTVGNIAAKALGVMGPVAKDASAALISALKDKKLRTHATQALTNIGLPAVPILIEGLKNRTSDTWEAQAQIIGKIGPAAKAAVPALIPALKDKDPTRRALAARVLGEIGPEANNAVPSLTGALKDPDPSVREHVLIALSRIEGSD